MRDDSAANLLFAIGDYVGGALIGLLTAAAVQAVVDFDMDMVVAMLLGMGIGTVVHLGVGLLLTPVLGGHQAMIPGSLIGMYGGMIFGMRDSMQEVSAGQASLVGAILGVIVVVGIRLYDRALRVGQIPGA